MIASVIGIFIAQFILIMLLGLQSLNVNRGHKLLAAITSFCLGVTGFYVTGTVASAYQDGMLSPIFISFIAAGPCGILASMKLHPTLVNLHQRLNMLLK